MGSHLIRGRIEYFLVSWSKHRVQGRTDKGSNRIRCLGFEKDLRFEKVLGFENGSWPAVALTKGSATARSRRRIRCGEAAAANV